MTEQIETELRRHLELWVDSDIPPLPDLVALEHEGRRRRLRRRGRIAAAAAVVVLVAVTSVAWALRGGSSNGPIPPVDSPTGAPTDTPSDTGMTNGSIVGAEVYFPDVCPTCVDPLPLMAFDLVRDVGLFARYELDRALGRVIVSDRDGQLGEVSCGDAFPCRYDSFWSKEPGEVTLGPGADEVTLKSDDQSVQVLAYDGSPHQTLDLAGALGEGEAIEALAWSPDGNRLAVDTVQPVAGGIAARVWLFDRGGGAAQLVYTVTFPHSEGEHPVADLSSLTWSPDGTRIGVVEKHEVFQNLSYRSVWQGVVVLTLPPAGQASATPQTLAEYPLDWRVKQVVWSPDGTRVAVALSDRLLELSADDGSEVARHPWIAGTMIWPQEG
jgi:hypothetical protein